MPRITLITPFDDWPDIDREAWVAFFTEGGHFDDEGPGCSWSRGTQRKFRQSYGHWLGFLERSGRLDPKMSPADRLTQDNVRAFHDDTAARVSVISTSSQLADLAILAPAFDRDKDWTWLKRLSLRYRQRREHRDLKPPPPVSSRQVYRWGLKLMGDAEAIGDRRPVDRAQQFRDGLMVALLIARPVRLRAFIDIRIDRQLVRVGKHFELHFAPADMKDHRSHSFPVPQELTPFIECYLKAFRPLLLKTDSTDHLWISRRGGPLGYDTFQSHLFDITERQFGKGFRPHAFRHIAATSIAEEDPVHVNIIASVLGHATLTMAERHYNRASGTRAVSAFQDVMRERRREAAKKKRK